MNNQINYHKNYWFDELCDELQDHKVNQIYNGWIDELLDELSDKLDELA